MINTIKFVLLLAIINVFWAVVKNISFSRKSNLKNIVKMPKWTLYFGVGGTILMSIALYNSRDDIGYFIIFSIAILIGIFILLSYFNNRVYYNEEGFVYKNFIGKKYSYTYDEILKCSFDKECIYIKTPNKKISINLLIGEGAIEFYKFIVKKRKD